MSDNYVQSANNTGTTTVLVTLTSVVAGNAIVAIAFDGNNATPAVHTLADAQGSYVAKGTAQSDSGNAVWGQAYILENANAGTHAATFTVTVGETCFLILIEVGTTANPGYSDAQSALQSNPGTGADALTTAAVTIGSASTLVAFSTDTSSASASDEPATGTGFTTRVNNANSVIGAFRLESKAAAANAAGTFTAITGTHNFMTFALAVLNATAAADTLMGQAVT